MAFVRYKVVKGRKYYQYVRNYRVGGRHKQEVLCHLGPRHDSLEGAIDYETWMTIDSLRTAAEWEKEADSTKGYLLEFYGEELGNEIPGRAEARSRWEALKEDRDNNLFEYRDGFFRYPESRTQEWEEEWERWAARMRVEKGLLDSILDYHHAMWRAKRARKVAEEHRAKRDKFTRIQQEYS
jgi:hypothetical protein